MTTISARPPRISDAADRIVLVTSRQTPRGKYGWSALGLACLLANACGARGEGGDDGGGKAEVGAVGDAGTDAPATVDLPATEVVSSGDGGPDSTADLAMAEAGTDLATLMPPAVPAQCRVTSKAVGPFDVIFRLVNRSTQPVYLARACLGVDFQIASCASRFLDSIGPTFVCACDCSDASCTSNPACGGCPPAGAVVVAPGGSLDLPWKAIHFRVEDRGRYSCASREVLPPAVYSLSVPVFESEAAAIRGDVAHVRSRTFELPSQRVELSIGDSPPEAAPCDVPSPSVPACATPWEASMPCGFDTSYTFAAVGGLRARSDEARLTPPNQFELTRMFFSPAQPPATCRNSVPRCGARHDWFTTADVMEALAADDVVAAFAQPTPLVYGHDSRPYDGAILSVRRGDGRGLDIGGPCSPNRTCSRPLTAGMNRLQAVLTRLEAQQRALPGCEALRQP